MEIVVGVLLVVRRSVKAIVWRVIVATGCLLQVGPGYGCLVMTLGVGRGRCSSVWLADEVLAERSLRRFSWRCYLLSECSCLARRTHTVASFQDVLGLVVL